MALKNRKQLYLSRVGAWQLMSRMTQIICNTCGVNRQHYGYGNLRVQIIWPWIIDMRAILLLCENRIVMEMDLDTRQRLLIPVMLRQCRVPEFIGRLTYMDVTNQHFWPRFIDALRDPGARKLNLKQLS